MLAKCSRVCNGIAIRVSIELFQTDIDTGIHVKGDRRALQQVITILLDNAVKYCDDGGTVAIALKPRSHGKGARITVSNRYAEGKNIDLSRFFERFYRLDAARGSDTGGTGLGLAIARQLTEAQGGTIAAKSENGTVRFTVTLPVRKS